MEVTSFSATGRDVGGRGDERDQDSFSGGNFKSF